MTIDNKSQTDLTSTSLTEKDLLNYTSKHNKYLIHKDITEDNRTQLIENFEADLADATKHIVYSCLAILSFIILIILLFIILLYYTFDNKYISINTAISIFLIYVLFKPTVYNLLLTIIDFIYSKIAPQTVKLLYQYSVIEYSTLTNEEDNNVIISGYTIVNKDGEEIETELDTLNITNNDEAFIDTGEQLIKISSNLKKQIINIKNTPNLIKPNSSTIDTSNTGLGDVIIVISKEYYNQLRKENISYENN